MFLINRFLTRTSFIMTSTTGWQNIDLSKYKLVFNHLDKIAITLQLVDYKPLEDTELYIRSVSKKNTFQKFTFQISKSGNLGV